MRFLALEPVFSEGVFLCFWGMFSGEKSLLFSLTFEVEKGGKKGRFSTSVPPHFCHDLGVFFIT